MSSKRRKQIFYGIVIVATLCAALVVYAIYQNNLRQAQLKELAVLDAVRLVERVEPSGELVVEADRFTVYESEITQVIDRNNLFSNGSEATVEQGVLYLTVIKAVYQVALDEGYDVTDEEIAQMIAEDKESMDSGSGYDDFVTYTAAMGITTDEYWELLLTDQDYRREIVVDKYLQAMQDILYTESGYEEDTEEAKEAWEAQREQLGETAMRQQNAVIVSTNEKYADIELYEEQT